MRHGWPIRLVLPRAHQVTVLPCWVHTIHDPAWIGIRQKGLGALSPGARAATAGTSLDKPGHDEFNLIGKCSNTGITGTVMACGLQVLFRRARETHQERTGIVPT
jgi:hypothetical protein